MVAESPDGVEDPHHFHNQQRYPGKNEPALASLFYSSVSFESAPGAVGNPTSECDSENERARHPTGMIRRQRELAQPMVTELSPSVHAVT